MAENAGTIYAPVELRLNQIDKGIIKLNRKLDTFVSQSKQRAGGFQKAWSAAFTAIGFLGAQAITKLIASIKQGVSVFAGFQQSIANVISVTKAFGEQQRQIEQAAKDAGETTRFSARQAADALYFLASAGLDARQSIDALDGVLQLAGATQSDLASTASTVTAVLSQFNLQAKEAERVSNVFAAAIANSQANMQKLTTAFRQVGPVAAGLGLSLEETTGALQLLFNAGFQGQQAGRALKSALADLASPTTNITKIFKKLNIDLSKVNPTTNEFADIIDELAKSGATTADIIDAFGKVAGPQIAVLVQKGADAIRDYTEAVTGTNAAAEAYAIQNKTLQGSIDILRSKAEGLAIAFFGELDPGLRKIINSFINLIEKSTPLISFFGKILDFVIKLVAGPLDAFAEGIGLVSQIFDEGLTTYEKVSEEFDKVSESIKRIGEIDTAINKLDRLTNEYEKLAGQSELSNEEQERLKKVIADIGKIVPDAATAFDEYGNAIAISTEKTRENAKQLLETRRALILEAKTRLELQKPILEGILRREKAEADRFKRERENLAREANIAERTLALRETFQLKFQKLVNEGIEQTTAFLQVNEELAGQLKDVGIVLETSGGKLRILGQGFKQLNQAEERALKTTNALIDALEEESEVVIRVEDAEKKLQELAQLELELAGIQKGLNELDKIDPVEDEAPEKAKEVRKEIVDFWKQFREDLEKATREAKIFGDEQDILKAKLDFLKDAYLSLLDEGLDPTSETLIKIKQLYDETADSIENLNQKQNDFIDGNKEHIQTVKSIIEKQKELRGERKKVFDEAKESVIDIRELVIDSISSFESLFNSIINLFSQLTENRLSELDEQLQAELEAAGVAEEINLERINRELEEARKAGDEEKIIELEKEKKKEQITLEFEKKKAQAEYQGALYSWGLTLLNAIAKLAEAILVATASAPFPANIPAIVAAGAAGINVGVVAAQKPQPPKFHDGGLVPGSQTTKEVPAILTSREGVFTLQDQRNLFDFVRNLGNNNQTGNMTIVVQSILDGDVVAESTINRVNNGQFQISPDRGLQ